MEGDVTLERRDRDTLFGGGDGGAGGGEDGVELGYVYGAKRWLAGEKNKPKSARNISADLEVV
jgi:hypothetical protein